MTADTTREIRPPWLLPPVTAVYARPNRWATFRRSPLVRHLAASASSAFWPCAVGCGVILALLIIAHLHGIAPISSAGVAR